MIQIRSISPGKSSGSYDELTYKNAFDGNENTSWRPHCDSCNPGDVWVEFSSKEEIKCIHASNLGEGSDGANFLSSGLKLSKEDESYTWKVVPMSNPISNRNVLKSGSFLISNCSNYVFSEHAKCILKNRQIVR